MLDHLKTLQAHLSTSGSKDAAVIDWAVAEINRLRKIEIAAEALSFSVYPAHGSGFVVKVSGDVSALDCALRPRLQMGEDLRPTSKV